MTDFRRLISSRTSDRNNSSGFTILESLLAISVLVTVFSQIIGVQASSLGVAKNTKANMQATWALRALSAQLEYIADVKGVKGLPTESSVPAPLKFDSQESDIVRFEYKNEQALIAASKFLLASMRLGQGMAAKGEDEGGDDKFKQFGELLDSQLPKDIYRTIKLTALWNDGQQQRSMELGMLMIDRRAVQLGIPGMSK